MWLNCSFFYINICCFIIPYRYADTCNGILIYIFTQCSPCLSLDKTVNLHNNHLTLARSRPVNGHVIIPHDIVHFLLVVFRTKPLYPAFLKILGPNCVTTLTFLGHVTSSAT